MRRKNNWALPAVLACSVLLSGCRMISFPGREPFGEQTYPSEDAQVLYQNLVSEIEQIDFSDWGGYNMEFMEGWDDFDLYRTEEYTAAWYEGDTDYLWYQQRLYCEKEDAIRYRDMTWEELKADPYAEDQWTFVRNILTLEPESLEYKYVPMASDELYLLTAEYPETKWNGQNKRALRLYLSLDGNGSLYNCTLHWQEDNDRVLNLSFFPYEDSCSLQAERKIWIFAHDLGLTDQTVPSLSVQEEEREWCRSVIAGMDFDRILEQAEYSQELTFPTSALTPD